MTTNMYYFSKLLNSCSMKEAQGKYIHYILRVMFILRQLCAQMPHYCIVKDKVK